MKCQTVKVMTDWLLQLVTCKACSDTWYSSISFVIYFSSALGRAVINGINVHLYSLLLTRKNLLKVFNVLLMLYLIEIKIIYTDLKILQFDMQF